jgi:cobalt-zinc-cadmium efflux system outer membrane protein
MKKISICFLFLSFFAPLFAQPGVKKNFNLFEIISLALENSPILQAKQKEVQAMEASFEASKHFTNPELEYQRGRAKSWDHSRERTTEGISLSQYVENPFKRHYRVQVFENDWRAVSFSYDTLTLEIIFEVKKLFYEILLYKTKQDLASHNLDSIQKIHRLIEKRVELGEIKELEAIKLYVEFLKAQNERNRVRIELTRAQENLNQLLGKMLPPDFELIGELSYAETEIEENVLLKKALLNHPQVKEREARLVQAKSNENYVRWQRFPDFRLSGFSHKELDSQNRGIGISVDIPLWNFKSREIQEAENLMLMEEEKLRALQLEMSAQIKSKIDQLKLSEQNLQVFHRGLLQQAERSLEISEISYTQGEISLIEYLDSQRTYFSILNDYQDSLYRWNIDKAALEAAVGEDIK